MLGPASTVFCSTFTIAMSQYAMALALTDPARRTERVRGAARRWAETMCKACGVEVRTSFDEPIDFSRPLLLMANHQSLFDIPVLYVALPEPYGMLAKEGLFRIPFFGKAMTALGCVPIDRSRRVDGYAAIGKAAMQVRAGSSLVVFPEGKRSFDGKLLPLKKGPFHLARMAQVPIVPVGIRGTHGALPRGSAFVKEAIVEVRFGAPFTVGPSAEDREEARQRLRDELLRLSG